MDAVGTIINSHESDISRLDRLATTQNQVKSRKLRIPPPEIKRLQSSSACTNQGRRCGRLQPANSHWGRKCTLGLRCSLVEAEAEDFNALTRDDSQVTGILPYHSAGHNGQMTVYDCVYVSLSHRSRGTLRATRRMLGSRSPTGQEESTSASADKPFSFGSVFDTFIVLLLCSAPAPGLDLLPSSFPPPPPAPPPKILDAPRRSGLTVMSRTFSNGVTLACVRRSRLCLK